ncbi:MAG: sugar ABC transporter permease YjfF [Armatimonadetes bacterium]|nr:sugar ABC transporter permease YjfF [Armatimonadota bacterium]
MKRPRLSANQIPLAATAGIALLLYGAAAVRYPAFRHGGVLLGQFVDNGFLGIAALGMTFVILSGGIDLSVGSVIAFVGVLSAKLLAAGWPPAAVIALCLLLGTAFGAGMGALINLFELPPFLVTLAGMFLARGLALVVSTESIAITHPWYQAVAEWRFKPSAAAFLAMFVVSVYLAHYTRFGRNVYALGGNRQSALLMGLPCRATEVGVYAYGGFCAALAGVVATLYFASGDATRGVGLELDAIAAVVIGGTLLTGGVGYVAGTLVGVLILGTIQTAITFEGTLNSWWTKIAIGGLLLAFILLQRWLQRRAGRAARRTVALSAQATPPTVPMARGPGRLRPGPTRPPG